MNIVWFLFSFQGRISRAPFWIFNIVLFLLLGAIHLWVLSTVPVATTGDLATGEGPGNVGTPYMVFLLLTIWPSLAVQAKRWHDTDRSAWWILINFVPLIGGIWTLVVTGFFPGTAGDNKFGPNPLAGKTDRSDISTRYRW